MTERTETTAGLEVAMPTADGASAASDGKAPATHPPARKAPAKKAAKKAPAKRASKKTAGAAKKAAAASPAPKYPPAFAREGFAHTPGVD